MSVPPEDVPMAGSQSEGEGDDIAMRGASDDSSEEGDDENASEEERIRQGFIVDESEEENETLEEAKARRKEKRRRRKKRKHSDDEDSLEADDLDLLEENTGASFKNRRLTRLRRASGSPEASSSKRRRPAEPLSSDDDLDGIDPVATVLDIQNIWDDDRGRDDEDDLDDMDNFIDNDDEEEGMTEHQRQDQRKQRQAERRAAQLVKGKRPKEITGIDANAWDEIHDVFGDGHEYDWALAADDDHEYDESRLKPEMRYQDVFEPSEIRARLLTDDDDLIRAQDIPERMQLATSTLSQTASLSIHKPLALKDLDEATNWVCDRLPPHTRREFFHEKGRHLLLADFLVKAVKFVLEHLFIHEFEVPYIWTHKQDYISWFHKHDWTTRVVLIDQPTLWVIYALGQKFRSYIERKNSLEAAFARLGLDEDEAEYYKHDIRPKIDSIDSIVDATEWLSMMFKDRKEDSGVPEFRFNDEEEDKQPEAKKRKLPSRTSAYDVTKRSIVSNLAKGYGIPPQGVVLNFLQGEHTIFGDDQDISPAAYADQFVDPDPVKAIEPEELLRRARMLLATEIGKDPLLRQHVRQLFKTDAYISVSPTERGIAKIDAHHPYFNFKYLLRKSVKEMSESAQFLHIMAAESEHLVTVSIFLDPDSKASLETKLNDAYATDQFSDTAKAWNDERSRVVQEALEQHLLPAGVKHTREWIREEVEDFLASQCAENLRRRLNCRPYLAGMEPTPGFEQAASVLAISHGKGDPSVDAVTCIFVDEAGRYREHVKLDNLNDPELKDEFTDLIRRRKPDVIAIGGFSMNTTRLSARVREIVSGGPPPPPGADPMMMIPETNEERFNIDIIWVPDDVARMFQHSKRASEEFNALSLNAKYCIGLARYVQHPLNEYAALGSDITAISFEDDQNLIPVDKLLFAFERVLVDMVNETGVDVNRAATDGNYQHLLPFVCGLGPRKAQVLVKKIGAMGGNLVNRGQFIKGGLLTTKIFLNAAGFLRIIADTDTKSSKSRAEDDVPDPLDNTRIHPEDYELARKMATDALELDEEDVQDEHPSHVVTLIMYDRMKTEKLTELNLDEFAVSMSESQGDEKRITLEKIRDELMDPFDDVRELWKNMMPWAVLTMLSGETPKTLQNGLIVAVSVTRIKPVFVSVRLDSGIEGVINAEYLSDHGAHPDDVVTKGQTIQGLIIDVKLDLTRDQFMVELSSRPKDLAEGDDKYRAVPTDIHWDLQSHERDVERQARKKRAEVDRTRRVIKHPNFHNFNSAQAETYLVNQQRGDVVIRPSSKGIDHLAVTWKVDDGVYQHIDVTEPNADPTGQTVGSKLIIDANHTYADLDELIVTHVQAMARRVDELTMHEKFKSGTEDDLHLSLKQFVAANPAKSMYGFALNRKRPGHFSLCFLANKNASVQTWPVRVCPEAFYLFDAPAAGVSELCDAFKVRHLHESNSKRLGGAAGGKTPYGQTPGFATPGGMSVRQAAKTPNPYSGRTPNAYAAPPAHMGPPSATPAQYGASYATPAHSGGMPPPQSPYVGGGYRTPAVGAGYQTPAITHGRTPLPGGAATPQHSGFGTPAHTGWGTPAPSQNLPSKPTASGMNPARAALINSANARGSGGGVGGGW